MNKSPAFQFYPDKWQSHTRRLSDSAYRVYHELLCWMWQQSPDQCSIEASAEAVSYAVAMPLHTVGVALEEIQVKFAPLLLVENGRFVSNGLRKETIKQNEIREKYRKNAEKRWSMQLQCDGNAMATKRHNPLSPSHIIKLSNKITKSQSSVLPLPFDSQAFQEAWSDWQTFRREIRHKLTPSCAKAQLAKLAKMGDENACASIRQSIENGWQGLFAKRQDKPSKADAADRPVWKDCAARCKHWSPEQGWCKKFVRTEPKTCEHCAHF